METCLVKLPRVTLAICGHCNWQARNWSDQSEAYAWQEAQDAD